MKEVDFLPEWYKSGKRRQVTYRTQYLALSLVLTVMIVWAVVAAHSVSRAKAELARRVARQVESENASREYAEVKAKLTQFQRRAELMDAIDSKIDVSSSLAEMSFLIDRKIVLREVIFSAEKLTPEQEEKTNSGSAVRPANGRFAGSKELPLGDVRFKVLISGVASDASDVAELICKLEESPYFCQVIPSYSRNKQIRVGQSRTGQVLQVSEFEIGCYLANYTQQEPYFARASQDGGLER